MNRTERNGHLTKFAEVPIEFLVKAERAIFLDPLDKSRFYLIPTYSALRSICEGIYWAPGLEWIVEKVRIMNPINVSDGGELSHVAYQVSARLIIKNAKPINPDKEEESDPANNAKKISNMTNRFLKRGGRRPVYMGKKKSEASQAIIEPCNFGSVTGAYDFIPEMNMGKTFHSTNYQQVESDGTKILQYFSCIVKNGVVIFPAGEDCPVKEMVPYWANDGKAN